MPPAHPGHPPLRVLLVGHCRFPLRPPFTGGLESITWNLATRLADRGHEVTVFAAEGTDCGPRVTVVTPEDLGCHIRRDATWEEARPDISATFEALAAWIRRSDVQVVHNNSLNPTLPRLARTLGRPLLTTLHTPLLEPMEEAWRETPPRPGEVVAVSGATAADWAEVVDADVVLNGIDTDHWEQGPGGQGLVWFGRIVPEKGPHVAVEIAADLGLPLHLAGPVSDEEYLEKVLRPAIAASSGPGVEYHGHLDGSELPALVGGAGAALVTPQWDEPFGLVAAEAASTGTPVLALARGGLTEVVSPGIGRRLDPAGWRGDIRAAHAECLELDRSDVRAEAVERFDLERVVDDYEARYRQLLERARSTDEPGA
ncbi:Glycosyltransferase involved in cell wall bisynthesis [Kytococcus aerolatus]|uniref:Glycosyltransferase involved in cell wall bisynthesis n=1 Tax=Kytococcus aerolatus TaxID=592308 RepID=A0A212THE1_9MICO|nr:glycosyltransferase [Kytococcus aerolatus]SNC65413.1 Glycosyltransferase involved in cell wall bisynthesis [Kytococcus aerolatus]